MSLLPRVKKHGDAEVNRKQDGAERWGVARVQTAVACFISSSQATSQTLATLRCVHPRPRRHTSLRRQLSSISANNDIKPLQEPVCFNYVQVLFSKKTFTHMTYNMIKVKSHFLCVAHKYNAQTRTQTNAHTDKRTNAYTYHGTVQNVLFLK